MSYKVVRDFLPTCAWSKLLRFVFTWVCRILQWQSRDTVIWPQWNLWDRAGWQGHCFQTSDEEVKQVRVCTEVGKKISEVMTHTYSFSHTKTRGKEKHQTLTRMHLLFLFLFICCLFLFYFFSIRLVSNIIHKLSQKYFSSSYAQLLFGNVSYHKVFFPSILCVYFNPCCSSS